MGYKTYTVSVEFDVYIKDNAQIVQGADSVTAAARHMLRNTLPTGWRKNGMQIIMPTVHVEAKEKELAQ